MKSFIVQLWAGVFAVLRCVSLFQLLRLVLPVRIMGSGFVDAWVLGNTLLAALSVVLSPLCPEHCWALALLIWGAVRVVEIFVYQINVLLWDPRRARQEGKEYRLLGYRRSLVLSLHNYAEMVLWFAAIHGLFRQHFEDPGHVLTHALGCLYFSVVTITTLGYGDVTPTDSFGWLLVVVQTGLGVFMALLILSRFVSLLPRPGSIQERDEGDRTG